MRHFPLPLKKGLYGSYEFFYSIVSSIREGRHPSQTPPLIKDGRTCILFYHLSLLSFGGTEKFLQILAKHVDHKKYRIVVMYSDMRGIGRKPYLENNDITFIQFTASSLERSYPFFITDMHPTLSEVINTHHVDIIVTAGSGYSEYPINTIRNIPIIMINIFGSPSLQKNIIKHVAISKEVQHKIIPLVAKERTEVMYIPSEGPSSNSRTNGSLLRKKLEIPDDAVVFGRIGRASDDIFDPIAIKAFKDVIKEYPHTHFIIQSPPPQLISIVTNELIPNIHFLEPTSDEEKVWAFHAAIDILAHFRYDGESCGLNIIEALLSGKPVITHRSHIWNAHLEYLDPAFSRVAEKDDIQQYASYMSEMIAAKNNGTLEAMGKLARSKAEEVFLIKNNIDRFQTWIDEALLK